MKQKDKAKAYDEVLTKAVALYKASEPMSGCNVILETLFPELAESEDEKVRKELIKHLKELSDWKEDEVIPVKNPSYYRQWASWLERQVEQKFTNKVEPKFEIGDWVINRTNAIIMQIVNNKDFYESVEIDGQRRTDSYNYADWDFRLWTIQDAKDGDVLIVGDEDDTGIAICGKNDKLGNNILYCYYDDKNGFAMNTAIASECLLHPATKERSDLLFAKMREAGYVWDAEKKEVRKIKQKSDSFCKENCKGFQETGKCFADGECKAKKEAKQKPVWSDEDEKMFDYALDMVEWYSGKNEDKSRLVSNWLKSLKSKVQPQNTK